MNNKKHWFVVLVSCGLAGSSIGICVNSMGVFFTPVANSLGILRGTFALHSTISMIATAIVSLFATTIIQRYHYKKVLVFSVCIAGISTMLMAYLDNVLWFYILGAIRGICTALFGIVPITMVINHWFVKHHGLATSIVLSFSGVVGAICSPILTNCIGIMGWQTTYLITGLIIIALGIPAILYPYSIYPTQDGLLPYGMIDNKKTDAHTLPVLPRFNFFSVTFIAFFIFAISHTAISGITQHLPGFAQTIGQSATVGAILLSAGMVGNILSKLAIGFLSDRMGPIKANVIMIVLNAMAILMLVLAPNEIVLLLGAFLFGTVYSVGAVGFALLTKYFFGNENYVKVFPIVSFATNLGGAFALSLVGYIYDFTGSYNTAFMIALAIHGLNIFIMILIVRIRNKHIQKVV